MFKYFWLVLPPILLIIMIGTLFLTIKEQEGRTVRYDCRISEISPDFPPQVREECRKLRSEAYKNGRI